MQLAAGRRFSRVDRSKPRASLRTCRGKELQGDRLAAHLAVLGTFDDLNRAKAEIAVTVGGFFGDACWRSREAEGLALAFRLLSEGSAALMNTVDASLDAWGAADGTKLVFEGMGQTLVEAGLAQVEGDVLVDGPRIKAARKTLRDQGYSESSEAMESATIEHILLTWLNFALSDPVLKERIPDFVYASCVRKSRERLSLTSMTARRWAHCLWGAFGNVAPELFVGLLDALWALGAGRARLLPRLNAPLGAGEVRAGPLFVLECAAAAVAADSPAASLLDAACARYRAATKYFAVARTARVSGSRPRPRIILAGDRTDLARTVRSRYRELLVFDLLAAQGRDDLVKGGDVTRLSAFQAELARDARDAAAAPTDAGGAAPATDGPRSVVTFECVRAAADHVYPAAEVGAMQAIIHDDVAQEHARQKVLFDALKRPGEEHDVLVVVRGVRSHYGAPPRVLAVFKTHIAADDTLSTKGLHAADNTANLTSPFGLLVLAAANAARTASVDEPLADALKGFGPKAPDGKEPQLVSYLWTTLHNEDDSNLLGSVQWSGAALNRRTGRLYRTWRDGPTGFDPLDELAAVHTPPHRRLSSATGDRDEDLRRYIRTSSQPRDVATLRCVLDKLAEATRFKQERAEAAAKADADAAAVRDGAAALTAAAADGPLTGVKVVLAGHGTTSASRLRGAGAFVGRENIYADDGELASLLRGLGAFVCNVADEPRSSTIFRSNGTITLCTDSRAILVLSDGYDRPAGRPSPWLDGFRAQGRAVKESYVRALADAGFDFDSVELEDHLAYEPETYTPRAI
jgi:hypothetical protein